MDELNSEEKTEASSIRNEEAKLLPRPRGGLLTMPFIIANESFEKVASYGLMPNMIFYLMKGYHMSSANGASILQLWSALSNFTPLLGAFISDSYLGKFQVIALGSIFSLLGVVLLWLTAMIRQAKPAPGESADAGQLALLYGSFILMSIGAGGIRPCSIAFGADQLIRNKDDPKNERTLQTYFSFYYSSIGLSTVIALTVIVYIQDHLGWKLGFGIPAVLMLLAVLTFYFGYSLYVRVGANKSLFTGLAQVIVVNFKNWSLEYPVDGKYHSGTELNIVTPSKHLRFLNKACIVRDRNKDVNPDGSTAKPWKLCTVAQVEALKALVRLLPIWSTGIIIYMALTQGTLTALQAFSMDRHMTSSFEIPAGTFSVFTVIALTIWVATYDRVVVPLLARFAGRPKGFSNMTRMGLGNALSVAAMAVAAGVEIVRRRTAVQQGLDRRPGTVDMSAFWLVPQFFIGGLAEGLNAVGQVEFYYSQLPKNMTSLAMALFSLNNAFAGLLGSFLVKTVDKYTKGVGKPSWVANNPNKGHYDYYYWLVTILCGANFLYFLVCCWVYGPVEQVNTKVSDEEDLVMDNE